MRFLFFFTVFQSVCCLIASGQDPDSILSTNSIQNHISVVNNPKQNTFPLILPASCILYGVLNIERDAPGGINFHRHRQNSPKMVTGSSHFDDYLQYIPAISVYALDALGEKPAHNFWQRTKILATGQLIASIQVCSIKKLSHVKRPDGNGFHSFPSGHTTTAFLGADFFYSEFKHTRKWWIYSGYVAAAIVGTYRVINNRHWASDVVAGAGFGILSNRLSGFIYRKLHKHRTSAR